MFINKHMKSLLCLPLVRGAASFDESVCVSDAVCGPSQLLCPTSAGYQCCEAGLARRSLQADKVDSSNDWWYIPIIVCLCLAWVGICIGVRRRLRKNKAEKEERIKRNQEWEALRLERLRAANAPKQFSPMHISAIRLLTHSDPVDHPTPTTPNTGRSPYRGARGNGEDTPRKDAPRVLMRNDPSSPSNRPSPVRRPRRSTLDKDTNRDTFSNASPRRVGRLPTDGKKKNRLLPRCH